MKQRSIIFDTAIPDGIYPDGNEAQRRLVGTVIKWEGRAYYVHDTAPGNGLLMSRCGDESGQRITVDRSDEGFADFAAYPVGFANIFQGKVNTATYITRVSSRRVQQGLTTGNCICDNPDSPYRFEHLYNTIGFREMIEGVYPTYAEILASLSENSSVAFDRRFALYRRNGFTFLLREGYGEGKQIALVTPNKILLVGAKSFLYEELLAHPQIPDNIEII